jgi:hypothetical protein
VRRPPVRFTIRTLMIAVAAVAGVLAALLSPTTLVVAFGLLYLALVGVPCVLIGLPWWMRRGFRRLSALWFGVVAASSNALIAAFGIYLPDLHGTVLMFLGWLLTFPIVISAGAAWVSAVTQPTARPHRSPFLAWPLVLVLGILPLTMLVTRWPLHLAFLASRPAMDRLADRVLAGQTVAGPEWAGLFRVVGSAVDPAIGNVGLITDRDPSGFSGFVRAGAGPGAPAGPPIGPFYNLSSDRQLDDRWWYERED